MTALPAERAVLEVRWGGRTDTGLHRAHNEDAFLALDPIFVVADGMGGHARGDAASATVIEAFQSLAGKTGLAASDVVAAIEDASRRVQALADAEGAPGSTVTGAALHTQGGLPGWLVFNIGDSRTYLLSSGVLSQVSVDHSGAREGSTTKRNVITRALGGGIIRPALADQWLLPARQGDRLVICSDGLTGEVSDELITAIVTTESEPQDAADRLVASALAAGGRDNVTVVVVDAVRVVSVAGAVADLDHTLGDEELESSQGDPMSDDTVPDDDSEGEA